MPSSTSTTHPLSARLRMLINITAVIDLAIGLAFLFGPELNVTLWPTAIPPILMRFIGSIVVANGVGAWLAARQGTWEGAKVIFTVALVYGAALLPFLLYHLVFGGAPPVLWIYAALDTIFLVPIAYIYWQHERSPSS
jgi:hypothetical protein